MTCTGIASSRAALATAASTPLALPVMTDTPRGSDFTYSVTLSGSAKCRLPTIATRNQPTVDALLPILPMFLSNMSRSFRAWRS